METIRELQQRLGTTHSPESLRKAFQDTPLGTRIRDLLTEVCCTDLLDSGTKARAITTLVDLESLWISQYSCRKREELFKAMTELGW